jgi:5-formyltetrahydrofolate cyclo-ligase
MAEDITGQPADLSNASPGELREHIWVALMRARAAAYPLPPAGHHPNFRGAAAAATHLTGHLFEVRLLKPADTVLCYPDYVLKPLRKQLLEHGVHVVVPSKYGNGYRLLHAGRVKPAQASSIAGAEKVGELTPVLPDVTFLFLACVGVGPGGEVLDKGYGFTVPEVVSTKPKATLSHSLQVLEHTFPHRLTVNLYATPEKVKNLSALDGTRRVD